MANFLQLIDAVTSEERQIEPSRMGDARWAVWKGRRVVEIEILRGDGEDSEWLKVENPPDNLVEQLIVKAPGARGIRFFSESAALGALRQTISTLVFGLGWSPDRVEALATYVVAEARELGMTRMRAQIAPRIAAVPPVPPPKGA